VLAFLRGYCSRRTQQLHYCSGGVEGSNFIAALLPSFLSPQFSSF
jgi:hypothetical protein